jgi:hypothetical protein
MQTGVKTAGIRVPVGREQTMTEQVLPWQLVEHRPASLQVIDAAAVLASLPPKA